MECWRPGGEKEGQGPRAKAAEVKGGEEPEADC